MFQKLIYLFCVGNGRNNYVNNLMLGVDLDKCDCNDVVFGNGIIGAERGQKRLRFIKSVPRSENVFESFRCLRMKVPSTVHRKKIIYRLRRTTF